MLQRAEEREDPEEEVALTDVRGKGRALGEVEDEGAADASGGLDDLKGRRERRKGTESDSNIMDMSSIRIPPRTLCMVREKGKKDHEERNDFLVGLFDLAFVVVFA